MSEMNLLPSPHAEGAKVLLDKIRALRAEIPRLVLDAPVDGRTLSARASIPDAFLEAASVAVQMLPRLEQAAETDAATVRDSYGFAISYDAVVQELMSLARLLASSIRLQRAEAAQSALDVYAFARRLSRKKGGAEFLPYVLDMSKKLNKRPRKANSNPAPAPVVLAAPPAKV